MKLLAYAATTNLGDAIQTVAMQLFLKSVGIETTGYVLRQNMVADMCVNGWHRFSAEHLPHRALFAGIHTDVQHLQTVDETVTIGARDPFTVGHCRSSGHAAIFAGCVTCTLPFYSGPRSGLIAIDGPGQTHTNLIPALSWRDQLTLASRQIKRMSRAEHVVTARLHVFLPCVALGTPVTLYRASFQPERFSVLEAFSSFPGFGVKVDLQSGLREEANEVWRRGFAELFARYDPIRAMGKPLTTPTRAAILHGAPDRR